MKSTTAIQIEVSRIEILLHTKGSPKLAVPHHVQNVFWGVVTNPNGQHTVLGAPAGS